MRTLTRRRTAVTAGALAITCAPAVPTTAFAKSLDSGRARLQTQRKE